MAGHQLAAYPSKYGRLKKYLKLAPDLLEVDLSDKDQEENYRQLEKYLKWLYAYFLLSTIGSHFNLILSSCLCYIAKIKQTIR